MLEDIEFPAPLQMLFEPKRYKVLYGGRGAGRSWGIADALLLMGCEPIHPLLKPPLRVLCARELQKSIDDSVHQILEDQIKRLGLEAYYIVMRDEIRGIGKAEGTNFLFAGLKNNITKIKSYEGVDIAWIEEAVHVLRRSWEVLIPTIRKPNSEIWMSFNPELKTDYTYVRFVLNSDAAESVVRHMTFRDNPWFPEVLQKDLEYDKSHDYDHYLNIWEGQCREQLEGAVYAKELRRVSQENRICRVPYEKSVPVDVFFDLGRRHQTACWFMQKVAMQYRILAYFADDMEEVTHYIRELKNREYVYGTIWLPHDARAKRLGMKNTIEEQFRVHFPNQVGIVPLLSIEDGINAARMILHNCYFDETECADGLDALRHYRYLATGGVDSQGKAIFSDKPDQKDWSADGADAFRYLAVKAPTGRRASDRQGIKDRLMAVVTRREREAERYAERPDSHTRAVGWMR